MVFIVSDTDKQNFPIDNADLTKRMREIRDLIPQPETRQADNNMHFAEKAFTLFKDCGLISKENVEALNDAQWCNNMFNTLRIKGIVEKDIKMNPLGGILRKEGLTMWSGGGLRYYCPFDELKVQSDIDVDLTKEEGRRGKSKLAVICEGVTYYISNDWYSNDKPNPTKTLFTAFLTIWAMQACENIWAENKAQVHSENIFETTPTNDVNAATPNETNTEKAILESLKELHNKVDDLTAQIEEIKNMWK